MTMPIAAIQPEAVAPAPAATPAQRDEPAEASFEVAFGQAKEKLGAMAQKLVASAFLMPMIAQMRDDPFKSDLFHGGFGEDAFMQQLDTQLADRMAAHANIPVVNTLTEHFTRWLKDNPDRVEHARRIRIDTLG